MGDQFLYSCEWDKNFVLNSLIHCLSVNKVISEWEWYGEILEFRWRHMWQNREQVQVGDDWFEYSRTIEQERAAELLNSWWQAGCTLETWIWNERLFFYLRQIIAWAETSICSNSFWCAEGYSSHQSIQWYIWRIQYCKYHICCSLWRWFRWLEPRTTYIQQNICCKKMKIEDRPTTIWRGLFRIGYTEQYGDAIAELQCIYQSAQRHDLWAELLST